MAFVRDVELVPRANASASNTCKARQVLEKVVLLRATLYFLTNRPYTPLAEGEMAA